MAIPKHILAVERPSSTVVKQRGSRYIVIKRTSRREGKRVIPVDLRTVGEIIDGKYVESVPRKKKGQIDIKDHGEAALCKKHSDGMLEGLAKVWGMPNGSL